ncbi:LysR family transcriptional regulator [Saccharopolyspora sp. 5N708]|uniref:LysR family transcriptional regulator n=1 Tax=Saccharopolyspora sp. 5N708 TaxID=3457424 RepID=UPI003FD15EC2
MELRYLESFLAVADERHFGRAAARLHLSQPSLSQHVQRLERAVGVRLVDRGPHRVQLTAAGAVFQQDARRLLGQLREAINAAKEADAGHHGTVRVGFNYPAGRRVLPATLSRLADSYPGLRPVLVEKRSGPQLAGVAAGELDVALVFGAPTDAAYASRLVFSTPLMALVATQHPLAARREVSFAELCEHRCLLFKRELSPACYDALVMAARHAGAELDVADEVDDSIGTAMVVATGSAVGFASAERATEAAGMGLKPIVLVEPEPIVDVCIVWSAGGAAPSTQRFLDCVAAAGPFTEPAAVGRC